MATPTDAPGFAPAPAVWDTDADPARSRTTRGTATLVDGGVQLVAVEELDGAAGEWQAVDRAVVLAWSQLGGVGAPPGARHLAVDALGSAGVYAILELPDVGTRDAWVAHLGRNGVTATLDVGP